MKKKLLVLAGLAVMSPASFGLTLSNAGFESPAINDQAWTAEGVVAEWTSGGSASIQDLGTSSLSPDAQEGENTCGLNGVKTAGGTGAYIYQTIKDDSGEPITVQPNMVYNVSVWIGRRSDTPGTLGGTLDVSLQDSESLSLLDTETYDLDVQAQGSWVQKTFYLSTGSSPAGEGTSELQIRFNNVAAKADYGNWYYQQIVLDDVVITEANVASDPVPANGTTLIPVLPTLSWSAPEMFTPSGYDVYLSIDPNLPPASKVASMQSGTTFTPAADLEYNTEYTWRVDSLDPNNGAPILYAGNVWTFTTVPSSPVITSQPVNKLVDSGATADFSVSADSSSEISYYWYSTVDGVNDTPDDDVLISSSEVLAVTASVDGYYYCKLENSGGSTNSNIAKLAVKRPLAHWTLDSLSGTLYVDSTGEGHNAEVAGSPVFVSGMEGNGTTVTSSAGYASVNTWNPNTYSDQLTISLWANWSGANSNWQGLLGKRNAWGADTMMWQLESQTGAGELQFKSTNSTVSSAALPVGQWEFVTVTFDGSTATLYRNGISAVSASFIMNTGTAANFMLGASQKDDSDVVDSTFNGLLDDIWIYNYSMDKYQVADMYLGYSSVATNYVCIEAYDSNFDFDNNCVVNVQDFAVLAQSWLNCGRYPESSCN